MSCLYLVAGMFIRSVHHAQSALCNNTLMLWRCLLGCCSAYWVLSGMTPAPAYSRRRGQPLSSPAETPEGAPCSPMRGCYANCAQVLHVSIHKAQRTAVHSFLQGVAPAPAYSSAWGQPQPPPAAATPDGAPYADAGINMTLALTGVSAQTLTPAARQAITNAVAQQVPGVGERPSHPPPSTLDTALAAREPRPQLASGHLSLAQYL